MPGIGAVAAGALFGAGMGAISASVAGAVSDYSSGNVRSLGEATKDTVISMITGAVTGAIGAAFPAIKWFGEGLIDVGSGVLTRGMYALLSPDMSADEKLAYVFDLKQMGVDFITGVAMHFAFKGINKILDGDPTKKIISDVDSGKTPLKNNMQKGNYGEMKMDAYFENKDIKGLVLIK